MACCSLSQKMNTVLITDASSEIVTAIREAVRGLAHISAVVSRGVLGGLTENRTDDKKKASELTAREREILQLIAEGKSSKEIAAVLNVSPRTGNSTSTASWKPPAYERELQPRELAPTHFAIENQKATVAFAQSAAFKAAFRVPVKRWTRMFRGILSVSGLTSHARTAGIVRVSATVSFWTYVPPSFSSIRQ